MFEGDVVAGEVRDERDDANFQKRTRGKASRAGQATLLSEEAVMTLFEYAVHATRKSS